MGKEGYSRTDLAVEVLENGKKIEGTKETTEKIAGFILQSLEICSPSAAEKLRKPEGNYMTISCGRIERLSEAEKELLAHLIAGRLRGMAQHLTGKEVDPDFSVFVAGLGNAELTADAIGPQTASLLTATRHLQKFEKELYRNLGCSSVAVLSPGVLGQTGIETTDLLECAIQRLNPDVVIAVDALAARSCERLGSTVQITDTGIVPGSGVGNRRSTVNRKELGVPVIAIGVPSVVDSSTLVADALEKAGITELSDALKNVLHTGRSFFVSPKESDLITKAISEVLSKAINAAFLGDNGLG